MFKIKKEKIGVVKSGIKLIFEYRERGFYKGIILHNGTQISCVFLKEGEIGDFRAKFEDLFEYDDLCNVLDMYAEVIDDED